MAQNALGDATFHGQGAPQDYGEAAKWYQKAADQGLVAAQSSLAPCTRMDLACRRTMPRR